MQTNKQTNSVGQEPRPNNIVEIEREASFANEALLPMQLHAPSRLLCNLLEAETWMKEHVRCSPLPPPPLLLLIIIMIIMLQIISIGGRNGIAIAIVDLQNGGRARANEQHALCPLSLFWQDRGRGAVALLWPAPRLSEPRETGSKSESESGGERERGREWPRRDGARISRQISEDARRCCVQVGSLLFKAGLALVRRWLAR